MKWIRLTAVCTFAATLLAAGAAFADPPACPGDQNAGCIWKNTATVTVKFNAALDADLEQVRRYPGPPGAAPAHTLAGDPAYTLGDAGTRWTCFQKAVDAWNAVLDTLCNGQRAFQLQAVQVNNLWGTQQTAIVKCADAGLANPDYPGLPHNPATGDDVFDRQAAYLGDGSNVTSTGYGGNKVPPIDPGWIIGNGVGTYTIDARLGETYPQCDGTDPGKLDEADIAWFTHVEDASNLAGCPVIPWDYRYEPNAGDPNDPGAPVPYKRAFPKPGPDAYDFYTVMLHELGHVLGLGHMTDPAGGNVMQPSLQAGDRYKISKSEIACLKQLYCQQATPTHTGTWGALKAHYR